MTRLLCLAFLLFFWANGVVGLDRYPKVHEDEPWIAAPGYTFWTEGHFGTALFAGFYDADQHWYGFMPLFSLLTGGALRLFGMGLFQARVVPLLLTLLTLALTFRVGAALFSPQHGALAVIMLTLWRVTTPTLYRVSGIPFVDMGRMVRYDDAVPVFGLAALWVVIQGMKQTPLTPRPPLPHRQGEAGTFVSGRGWRTQLYKRTMQASSLQTLHSAAAGTRQALSEVRQQHLSPSPLFKGWGERERFLLVGILCGLAALSHLYGAFWLPALLLSVIIIRRARALSACLWAGVGFGVTMLPYALYALADWNDFRGQYRNLSDRFGLLDAGFYTANLTRESIRYQPVIDALGQSLGAKVGVALLIAGGGWLAYQALRRGDVLARIALLTCLVLVGLIAALLSPKTTMYLMTLWSPFALIAAAGFWGLWNRRAKWLRLALIGVAALASGEGVIALRDMQTQAAQTTPYTTFTRLIADALPPNSRLLAMQHYWFGLAEHTADYRTLLVPINLTNPRYVDTPIPFGAAADAVTPTVILFDQVTLDFLRESSDPRDPFTPLRLQMWAYLSERGARQIATLSDSTYGEAYLYELSTPP